MFGKARKQALLTRLDDALARHVSDLLVAAKLDVHRAHWDQSTLELVQSIPFDVIVLGFPLSDSALADFVAAARAEGSACRRAGLVLVSDPEQEDAARSLLGRGANRVVVSTALPTDLVAAVEELGQSAPRLLVRAPARIKLFSDGRPLRLMAQIENLSTSGMLLRGVTQFPVGTAFEFELTVPGESAPIRGSAEITRATDPAHEPVKGIGVRFVSFPGSERVRLEMYLNRMLA